MFNAEEFCEKNCPDIKHVYVFDPVDGVSTEESKKYTIVNTNRLNDVYLIMHGMLTMFKKEVLANLCIIFYKFDTMCVGDPAKEHTRDELATYIKTTMSDDLKKDVVQFFYVNE